MKCPKCGFVTFDHLDRCKRCGADWVAERVRLGIKRPLALGKKESGSSALPGPKLAPHESASDPEGVSQRKVWIDEEFDGLHVRLKEEERRGAEVRWGGFLRRACALLIDVTVLFALSLVLFYFTYVGYSVGLMAHRQGLSVGDIGLFLRILLFAWVSLAGGYFVLLHGMEGKTVGKWLLGLRVVAANKASVTYAQALIRWLASIPSALFGIGFLWILLNREKRGWHDLLARTWVIRDLTRGGSLRD